MRRSVKVVLALAGAAFASTLPAGPASADLTLGPPSGWFTPNPSALAPGDFDGDGRTDMAATSYAFSGSVSVLPGRGDGGFLQPAAQPAPVGFLPVAVASADFNRDGDLDLVTADVGSSQLSVLLGTGSGSFAPARQVLPQLPPLLSVVVSDFNGDGIPDLATSSRWPAGPLGSSLEIFLGDGRGGFGLSGSTFVNLGDPMVDLVVADMNGDGNPDVAGVDLEGDLLNVLLGDGAGQVTLHGQTPVGSEPHSIEAADFDGDGSVDLATANQASDDVSVFLGDGSGGLGAPTTHQVGSFPQALVAADLDGDAIRDLAVANGDSDDVSVLLGEGDGGFAAARSFPVGDDPIHLVASDLNRDGARDLATADYLADQVTVLPNAPTATPDPAALSFGSQADPVPTGTVSSPRYFTLTNEGSAPLELRGFAFSGDASQDFIIGAHTCEGSIPPGAACAVEVRFAPGGEGVRQAALIVQANADANVALEGVGGPLPAGPTGPSGPPGSTGEGGPAGPTGPRGPSAEIPTIRKIPRGAVLVPRSGRIGVVRIGCPESGCSITEAASWAMQRGRTAKARVLAPREIAPSATAKVSIQVPDGIRRGLVKGRKSGMARLSVSVTSGAGGRLTRASVKVGLKG